MRFADPEYEHAFRTYANYLEDLSGLIAGRHGFAESLVDGVHSAVLGLPQVVKTPRRRLAPAAAAELDTCLRRAWSFLRRALRELEDEIEFDAEANGWLPEQCYYAVFHAGRALAVATAQNPPRDHAAGLRLLGDQVVHGKLPFPWSATCEGCPHTGSQRFSGIDGPGAVHPLASPGPETASDRLAMFLRTTRQKELDRLFDQRRHQGLPDGKRRNISRQEKERAAARLAPTTIFDLLWRMRKKAHYEAPDTFIFGANGDTEARHFAECLVLVTDATVAAIEGVICAYVGPEQMARMTELYGRKTRCPNIRGRAKSWDRRVSGRPAHLQASA